MLLVLTISSCTKDADVKLPDIKPKPVLTCFISPGDSIVTAKLTYSRPIYKSQPQNLPNSISDAIVEISDGTKRERLTYVNDSVGYQSLNSAFKIEFGKLYFLYAQLSDGTILSSQTITPGEAPSFIKNGFNRQVLDSNEFFYIYKLRFDISIADKKFENNEYRILSFAKVRSVIDSTKTIMNLIAENYVTDLNKDGEVINASQDIEYFYQGEFSDYEQPTGYYIYLINGNSDYIKYHKDLQRFEDGNPFSEPIINFSNINGGIGCFGAFTSSTIEF